MPTEKKSTSTRKVPSNSVVSKKAGTAGLPDLPRTRLSDFRERFLAMIAELEANPDVRILCKVVGDPTSPAKLDAVATRNGFSLSAEERDFYARMNGSALVWAAIHSKAYDPKVHKPKKGWPTMPFLEGLDVAAIRIISMPPFDKVFERPFDYSEWLDESPPRIGFDFPGNYTTPAFVIRDGRITVEVGDDHGACWDGRSTSFEDYVETVLATYGDVTVRRDIYVDRKLGVGRAHFQQKPFALASILPARLELKDEKEERKLRNLLSRTYTHLLDAKTIALAVAALRSTDTELVKLAALRLLGSRHTGTHLRDIVAMMDGHSEAPGLASLADIYLNVELDAPACEMVLKLGENRTQARARVGARAGAAILPVLRTMLSGSRPEPEKDARLTSEIYRAWAKFDDDAMSALHTVILLGPVARELEPLVEKFVAPIDVEGLTNATSDERDATEASLETRVAIVVVAALACIAMNPSRAEELCPHLRVAIRSSLIEDGMRGDWNPERAHDFAPTLAKLPASVSSRLAMDIVELVEARANPSVSVELLGSLGPSGIDAGFHLLDAYPSSSDEPGFVVWRAVLARAFVRAALSDEQRARAARYAKKELLRVKKSKGYLDPDLLAFLCLYGGFEACAPELSVKKAASHLVESLPDQEVRILRSLFDLLEREVSHRPRLHEAATKILEKNRIGNVGALEWLTKYLPDDRV